MGRYNEDLMKAGILLSLDGLAPTATARGCGSTAVAPRSPTARSPRRKSSSAATG